MFPRTGKGEMATKLQGDSMCEMSVDCDCRMAVTRTFRELRDRNVPDESALESAARVYRFHHPKVSEEDARSVVSRWLLV